MVASQRGHAWPPITILVWTVASGGFCLGFWLPHVTSDSVPLGWSLFTAGVTAGVASAATAYLFPRCAVCGPLLVLSALTPTGFAYPGNVVALLCGGALLIRPIRLRLLVRDEVS